MSRRTITILMAVFFLAAGAWILLKQPEIRATSGPAKTGLIALKTTDPLPAPPPQIPKQPSPDATANKEAALGGDSDEIPADQAPPTPVISNPRAITPADAGDFIAPRMSPDGLAVLYTGPKYKGLYVALADGSDMRQISDKPGIGYKARWSADSTAIIVEIDGRTKALDLYGFEVAPEQFDKAGSRTVFTKNDDVYYNPHTDKSEEKEGKADTGEDTGEDKDAQRLTGGEDTYFNPVLSPDESHVAYIGLASGIHIKNIKTEEVVYIGQGINVQWTPDGRGLIYNYTQDDGEQVIDGDIYFAAADGTSIQNLTNTPRIIELHPNLSADGSAVTYEVDGQVFIADISGL